MRILHIGDQAGSAALLSHECSKLGHDSKVINHTSIDTFRIGEYYNNTTWNFNEENIRKALKGVDHLVYHDQFIMAEILDNLHIPSSYMFHGNMLRQDPRRFEYVANLESVDNMFVTTEDMLEYAPGAELFTRPVDIDLFRPMNLVKHNVPLCLTQERYFEVIKRIYNGGTGMFLVDRVKNITPYHLMPMLLNSYRGYIDLKFQPTHPPTLIPELSQTGLQALACGIPVVGWNMSIHRVLPKRHYAENVAREFIRVLQE